MVLNLRKSVRRINKTIPILFMSAKDDLSSKQKGFRLGIDDYMVKPIELDELLLRVRALLRRANIAMSRKIKVVNLELDADVDHRNYCCFIYFSYKCL
ncbi:response regulator [Traorella massiliensis]|uniref:response regulator n=1 Tax=Traorella massiliensis TaxID=1903263 RepID=UPI00248DD157|nr:response regulator [Traorella massiliensis]